jgi:hypothetical protein
MLLITIILMNLLQIEQQKLRTLTENGGVFIRQTSCKINKKCIFEEFGDAHNLIEFTGVQDSQGNVIDGIYPFNNIDDLVTAFFYQGSARVTDLRDCVHNFVLLKLQSNPCNIVLLQDIGKEGHKDYADLSSFVD